ncbi:MAG: flavin-dependent dehydrogenase [Myxococcota bacterium]
MTTPIPIDVAVVGGGPAGAAAALTLLQRGRDVRLFDEVPRDPVGETLVPGVGQLLAELGLDELLQQHQPSPGSEALWGSATPHHLPFFVHARGPGWHLDRARFDAALRAPLGDAWVPCAVRVRDGFVRCDDGVFAPRFMIDASGRQRVVGRAHGVERVRYDRTVARYRRFSGGRTDHTTRVEAAADGWWYAATVPTGDLLVAQFSDDDTGWQMPPGIADRVGDATQTAAWSRPAWVETPTEVAGADWLLAGDAALASDPLASLGIARGLETGISAAQAADAVLDGDDGAPERYAQAVRALQVAHLEDRQQVYQQEMRFADRPFWRHRHQRVDLDPAQWLERAGPTHRGLYLPPSELAVLADGGPRPAAEFVHAFVTRMHRPDRLAVLALQSLTDTGALVAAA